MDTKLYSKGKQCKIVKGDKKTKKALKDHLEEIVEEANVKTQVAKTKDARIRIKAKKLKTASFEITKEKFRLTEEVERGLEIKKRLQRKMHRLQSLKPKKSSNADRLMR